MESHGRKKAEGKKNETPYWSTTTSSQRNNHRRPAWRLIRPEVGDAAVDPAGSRGYGGGSKATGSGGGETEEARERISRKVKRGELISPVEEVEHIGGLSSVMERRKSREGRGGGGRMQGDWR